MVGRSAAENASSGQLALWSGLAHQPRCAREAFYASVLEPLNYGALVIDPDGKHQSGACFPSG